MMADTTATRTTTMGAMSVGKPELHSTRLKSGDKALDFRGTDQNGNIIELRSFEGRSFLLYFFPKSETPPCNAQACGLRDAYNDLQNAGIEVLGVSADELLNLWAFADKYRLPFPLISDTGLEIIKAYDVWGMKDIAGRYFEGIVRTSFIINGGGFIEEVITKVNTKNHGAQVLELIKK